MEEKNVNISGSGLKCDNPKCDWKDDTIELEKFGDWVNRPCPKCGENVLTEEDHKHAKNLLDAISVLNSLTPGEIKLLNDNTPDDLIDALKKTDFFKDAKGIENLDGTKDVTMTIESHGGIRITEVKPK